MADESKVEKKDKFLRRAVRRAERLKGNGHPIGAKRFDSARQALSMHRLKEGRRK